MPGVHDVTAPLGPRFHVVNALPAAVVVGFATTVWATGAFGDEPSWAHVEPAVSQLGVTGLALLLAAATLLAFMSNAFQMALVRALEGYWSPTGVRLWLLNWALERHRHRRMQYWRQTTKPTDPTKTPAPPSWTQFWLSRSGGTADDWLERHRQLAYERLRRYPPFAKPGAEDRIMPTRLGNALREAEDRAGRRYGLEATQAVPYLLAVASPTVTALVDDARVELDAMVKFVWASLLCTFISALAYYDDGVWMLLSAGAYLTAWVFYLSAVRAARDYGQRLVELTDLHRFDVLRSLHCPLPSTTSEEPMYQRVAWEVVSAGSEAVPEWAFEHGGTGTV